METTTEAENSEVSSLNKEEESDSELEEEWVKMEATEKGETEEASTNLSADKTSPEPEFMVTIKKEEKIKDPIDAVVDKIIKLTILFDLEKSDWNKNVCSTIRKFVTTPEEFLLTIYFEDDCLKAKLGFPSCRFLDIQYFARLHKNAEITRENFLASVMFGTLDEYPERTICLLLQNVYCPYFFNRKIWPDGPDMSLRQAVHTCLGQLTESRFNLMGLTGFYIPTEAFNRNINAAIKDRYLIARLDRIVLTWHTAVKKAILSASPDSLFEGSIPLDAYMSALNRYENICGIIDQLNSQGVSYICNLLALAQSPYIQPFLQLEPEILEAKEKARNIAEYLQVLEKPCTHLDSAIDPLDIPSLIPGVLKSLKFIWARSTCYSEDKQLQMLCVSLSNHIVFKLKKMADFKAIFYLKPRCVIPDLQKIIICCENVKRIFKRAVFLHNKYHPRQCNLDEELIFHKINILQERCKDMLEIAYTIEIFGRINEAGEKMTSLFFWTRTIEISKVMKKIEEEFWNIFNEIKPHQNASIDENSNVWCGEMKK